MSPQWKALVGRSKDVTKGSFCLHSNGIMDNPAARVDILGRASKCVKVKSPSRSLVPKRGLGFWFPRVKRTPWASLTGGTGDRLIWQKEALSGRRFSRGSPMHPSRDVRAGMV